MLALMTMTNTLNPDTLDLTGILNPGDRIIWGQGSGEPLSLIAALDEAADHVSDLSAFVATSFSGAVTPDFARKVRMSSIGGMGQLRRVAAERLLDIIPCHFGQVGKLVEAGIIGCDVAFVQVSPADDQGNHSYGLTCDFMHQAVANARVVVAEINDQLPFTLGDHVLPAAKIDFAVHTSHLPVMVPPATPSVTDQAIAQHVADFISDGATLQVGIGSVPDAVMQMLGDRRDLGLHSGMIGDGALELIERGVITNARKPMDTGQSVTGLLMGTERLFRFAHRNPAIAMRSIEYTHNETVLCGIPNLVTLNSALEVDVTGQVNAEATGGLYSGGTGGQIDFVRAGSRSPGGRSIIALPSTAKGGTISRIVVALNGPVSTPRAEVDTIVTEYGAAELKGQPLRERIRRMIAIAHPNFQDALARDAHEMRQRGF
jgi:acyl-CoA hydrolase